MTTVCAEELKRPRWRRALETGWVAIWVVFLGAPLQEVWQHNGALGRFVGVTAIVAFGALYVSTFMLARAAWRASRLSGHEQRLGKLSMLATLAVLVVVAIPYAGAGTLTMLVYLAAAMVFTLNRNVGAALALALAVVAETSARTVSGWQNQEWSASLAILFAAAAVYAARVAFGRNQDLVEAREEMAQMAIEEERSRMTRDLHDILGHSLTVIAIKAELAGRLVGNDESRAAAEVADIERLAREALTDVRATIAGRRQVSLAPELVNARAALASANIEAQVPNAVDDVPAVNRELFGWAVREGVTNVLRHSKASRCEISLTATSVAVHDDGVGANPVDTEGNGLRGLRERVAGSGGAILTGASPLLGGFLLEVSARGDAGDG